MTPPVVKQLAHELDVIERTGLAEFFLICWDLMRFAKERRIPAQGRGSAADSIVAYVLGITRVDPIRHNLLFERFINEGRTTYPDVDIDFSSERREEVIQYVYERYGAEHTGMVCNLVTYRARSAVREVGYALGFPRPLVDRVAKALETYDSVMVRRDLEADGGFAEFFRRPDEPRRGRRGGRARRGRGRRLRRARRAIAGSSTGWASSTTRAPLTATPSGPPPLGPTRYRPACGRGRPRSPRPACRDIAPSSKGRRSGGIRRRSGAWIRLSSPWRRRPRACSCCVTLRRGHRGAAGSVGRARRGSPTTTKLCPLMVGVIRRHRGSGRPRRPERPAPRPRTRAPSPGSCRGRARAPAIRPAAPPTTRAAPGTRRRASPGWCAGGPPTVRRR